MRVKIIRLMYGPGHPYPERGEIAPGNLQGGNEFEPRTQEDIVSAHLISARAGIQKGPQPEAVKVQGQGCISLLEIDERPKYLQTGSESLPRLENVGGKTAQREEPGGPLGEIPFPYITAYPV